MASDNLKPNGAKKVTNISTNSLKTMMSSVHSSGTSTPVTMEKTDSVINLTKPPLYGIYNEDSVLDLSDKDKSNNGEDDDDAGVTMEVKPTVKSKPNSPVNDRSQIKVSRLIFEIVFDVIILTLCALIYNELSSHIRNDHIKLDKFSLQPLYITELLLSNSLRGIKPLSAIKITDKYINYGVVLTVQGLFMGLVHPIADFALPEHCSNRLLSSNPNKKQFNRANFFNDLLRLLITFLGISYAIRNIEWNSQLQVLIVWSLINPGLWLLLDGTISGFLSSLMLSIYACLYVLFTNFDTFDNYASSLSFYDLIPIWLWIGSFFFCGATIFGKVGRALFTK